VTDSERTVTVSRQDCPDRGATAVASYRDDGGCRSPVVYADGE
jgi:hypothetical protein